MKLTNGHWLTPGDYPNVWDPTGNDRSPGNREYRLDTGPGTRPRYRLLPYLMTPNAGIWTG